MAIGRLSAGAIEVSRDAVRVGTATVPVLLGRVQPAGKKAMEAGDWARGVRPEPHEAMV